MIKITPYSDATVQQFYNGLLLKQKSGIHFEYDIRVDDEQITPRSKDLSDFFAYERFIFPETQSIEIWVYKGASRRYDKYVFERSKKPSEEASYELRLAEEIHKIKVASDFSLMSEKLRDFKDRYKDLKSLNRELKDRINALESEAKNANVMQGLLQFFKQSNVLGQVTGSASLSGNESERQSTLGGIPDSELLSALGEISRELGEETFQSLLGTAMMLGKNPALIPAVRKMIEEYRPSKTDKK